MYTPLKLRETQKNIWPRPVPEIGIVRMDSRKLTVKHVVQQRAGTRASEGAS